MVFERLPMRSKEQWVKDLDLQAHPEGGYYKETYRSDNQIELSSIFTDRSGKRNLSTGIYFLLDSISFSAFHRIQSDEMWHFYDGDSLLVHCISPEGDYHCQRVGRKLDKGDVLQFVVKAGTWFASEVEEGGDYSLVGCTVSYGFDFQDFELAGPSLMKTYPNEAALIQRLIRA